MRANLPDDASDNMLFEKARFNTACQLLDEMDKLCAACQTICSQVTPRFNTDTSPFVGAWCDAYLA